MGTKGSRLKQSGVLHDKCSPSEVDGGNCSRGERRLRQSSTKVTVFPTKDALSLMLAKQRKKSCQQGDERKYSRVYWASMRRGSTAGELVEAQEFEIIHMFFFVRQLFVVRWVTDNEYPDR